MLISIDTESTGKNSPSYTMMKEIDKDIKKWNDILCPWLDIT